MIKVSSKKEAEMLWKVNMELLRDHTKWLLDNLEYLEEFKVPWNNYSRVRILCAACLEFNPVGRSHCKACGCKLKNKKTHTFGVGMPPED